MVKNAKSSARAGSEGKAAKNPTLATGVKAFSAARMVQKKGSWRTHGVTNASTKAAPAAVKQAKFYPADDIRKPKARRFTPKAATVRPSITPGTVLILLSGRHRGKRVVFLESEPSTGLLVVTGPYKINGVPLRKVNQAFVIATSTKVSVAGVPAVDYSIFAKVEAESANSDEAEFLQQTAAPVVLPASFLAAQKATDAKLIGAIKKVPQLKAYVDSRRRRRRRAAAACSIRSPAHRPLAPASRSLAPQVPEREVLAHERPVPAPDEVLSEHALLQPARFGETPAGDVQRRWLSCLDARVRWCIAWRSARSRCPVVAARTVRLC